MLLLGAVASVAAAPAAGDGALNLLHKPLDAHHVLLEPAGSGAVRTFVTQAEAPGHRQAADLAVQRLERDGGFERSAIVAVLPTGSGWVNRAAVEGLEAELDGGVATSRCSTPARSAGRPCCWHGSAASSRPVRSSMRWRPGCC